eukprot:5610438-Pyramimonas_sp.AAC.2
MVHLASRPAIVAPRLARQDGLPWGGHLPGVGVGIEVLACGAAARLEPQVGACPARAALHPLVHGRAWADAGPRPCLQRAPARAELRLGDAVGVLGGLTGS